jgi:holo-[acyl-carrier protein] synthase
VILGVGIDVVEVERIDRAVRRHGERFLRRIFTESEVGRSMGVKNSAQHLAARFAAKEAAVKALGTGASGEVRFRQVEVTNDASGRPGLSLAGGAARVAEALGARRLHVSLTHTASYAAAVVVLEGDGAA